MCIQYRIGYMKHYLEPPLGGQGYLSVILPCKHHDKQ